MQLRVCKSESNPAGRPLGQIARELRLELEPHIGRAQAAAMGRPALGVAFGLQVLGLLLQLEALDQQMRATAEPLEPAHPAITRFAPPPHAARREAR